MVTLLNEHLTVKINETGAELKSIQDTQLQREYLWNGNPAVWKRTSPILFPIVGRLKNNSYLFENQQYSLTQHGFARDLPFEIVSQTTELAKFKLSYTQNTLACYPFKFELYIAYILSEKTLTCHYEVHNVDSKTVYFSIGAHPAFNCPLNEQEKMEDYYLSFSQPETLPLFSLSKEGLINPIPKDYLKHEKKISLSYELFKIDTLIFENYHSDSISLMHKDKGEVFNFQFKGYPFLGIWSKPGPYVCIEPWYGLADFTDHNGQLTEKRGIQTLHVDEKFNCTWGIRFS